MFHLHQIDGVSDNIWTKTQCMPHFKDLDYIQIEGSFYCKESEFKHHSGIKVRMYNNHNHKTKQINDVNNVLFLNLILNQNTIQ